MKSILFNVERFEINPNKLESINKDYNFYENDFCFGILSKINVFIGENNSGKSRFLRSLFSKPFMLLEDNKFNIFFTQHKKSIYTNFHEEEVQILKFIDTYKALGNQSSYYANVDNEFFSMLKNYSQSVKKEDKFYFPVLRGIKDYKSIIKNKLDDFAKNASVQNKDSIYHFINLLELKNNGLENFDIYNDIILDEYFKNSSDLKNNILTGGKLYQEIKNMLLGNQEQRKLIKDFESFLENNFFNGEEVLLIPNEEKKVLYLKIGDKENEIYNWGDGTQQLILILYSLFKHKDENGKKFFIEEPEMYFHPGLLRKFIEILALDEFKNHQIFITTHSNVVLDVSADIETDMSIFKFKKVKDKKKNNNKDFLIEQCNSGDISLLNELGVRNSSLFLSNCSIWVEGITDRLYLKHYLKLYFKKNNINHLKENLNYTFIEYGGLNIAHFNFSDIDELNEINAKYINNKIFLITDNDNVKPGSKKQLRKEKLKEILLENFYDLESKEIENLITPQTLRQVLIKQNTGKESLINEKIKDNIDYKHKGLGKFIDSVLQSDEIHKYATSSGTIKNKLPFCKDVIELTDDYDSLSEEAKSLTEKIYNFIEINND